MQLRFWKSPELIPSSFHKGDAELGVSFFFFKGEEMSLIDSFCVAVCIRFAWWLGGLATKKSQE
jgi:hypothetical protein